MIQLVKPFHSSTLDLLPAHTRKLYYYRVKLKIIREKGFPDQEILILLSLSEILYFRRDGQKVESV